MTTQKELKENKKLMILLRELWITANKQPIDANGGISYDIKQVDQAHDQIMELWKDKGCPVCSQRRLNNQMGYSNQHPLAANGVEL